MAGYSPTRNFTPAQRQAMDRITSGLPTKSAKMRALAAAGHARAEIAAYLGTSYQHVRSVLGAAGADSDPDRGEVAEAVSEDGSWGAIKLDEGCALRLPDAVLAALDAEPGMWLAWRLDGDRMIIMGPKSGLTFVQDFAQQFVVEGEEPWSDQLIRERRAEAAREDEKNRASDG